MASTGKKCVLVHSTDKRKGKIVFFSIIFADVYFKANKNKAISF